jgi:S-adenosylmethionine uptake transporter
MRSAITCVLILMAKDRLGSMHFRIGLRDWVLIGLRAASEVVIAYFFINALFNMPIANLTAILQVVPLTVTLASMVFLREAVGWQRLTAIMIGFFGVLLIVKPGADGFNTWSIYALIAMFGVTFRDLITRRLSPGVPSITVTLVTAATVMSAAFFASLTAPWVSFGVTTGLLIAGSAVAILGGYFFSVQVMRAGDISFTAPFRYTGLVFALIAGWLVFSEWPDTLTQIGAVIVVATGIFTFYRERKLSRR